MNVFEPYTFSPDACASLAATHGTPSFVYRVDRALAAYARLRRAMPKRVEIAYAVKANPHRHLLAAFAAAGIAFDCASLGELDRLASLGVLGSRIFFAGPGKRDVEIEAAVSRGVRIQAEGLEDLIRVDEVARSRAVGPVAVNLRVQPLGVDETNTILGGSGPTAFGVDEEDLPAVLAAAATLENVSICGVHGFAASNETDAARLLRTYARMFEIGERVQQTLGRPIEQLDLGGGLGVPYTDDAPSLDLEALGRGLADLLRDQTWFQGTVILEPGRFLVADCGTYLSRVVRTKTSRGTHFAILEGGINHLLRPLLVGSPFPVRVIGRTGALRPTTLTGPLCTALDRLGDVMLPPLQPGDLLAFDQVGAYGATEAMVHFLDHPPAPEIWVEGTDAQVHTAVQTAAAT